jgi:Flp pilus assembly protein TadG
MLKIMKISHNTARQQRGVAAVEFAIVAMLLFTLLFGIIEFGRLFYVFNSVQEVTRRAAREAVVRWTDKQADVKKLALFGASTLPANLPAGAEITDARINIDYLNASGGQSDPLPNTPSDNIAECLNKSDSCIAYVRVSITGATYAPMVSLFPYFSIPIPASTVTMPAESMGYAIN